MLIHFKIDFVFETNIEDDFEAALTLGSNFTADGRDDDDEAKHDDEGQLCLQHKHEFVSQVGWVRKLFEPRLKRGGVSLLIAHDSLVHRLLDCQESLFVVTCER